MAGHNELNSNNQFHFISMQSPKDQGRTARRLVRSHAVARGLENKRRRQQKLGHNFHPVSLKDVTGQSTSTSDQGQGRAEPLCSLSTSTPGPLQMLAAESPRLQALSSSLRSRQSREPAFSVSDELVLQNLPSILRKGQDDRALLSAVMLTFSFAAAAGEIDCECLQYQGEALSCIRQSISSLEKATTESTLGAILLLAGIEVRITFSLTSPDFERGHSQMSDLSYRLESGCLTKSNFIWGQ
ncbi:uncharacterized protein N7459_001279 [Penicillium hispanicum]|uniref:uncharacterized protein n=1 Tax=Penicillium hispanicum TaxID=1080232 RepID=UPI00253F66C5|nr:uncharacterized protein N7459_001279 [Penicillium hispanicum]KAJ5595071.1 hypothetical protein N7459_001279 [Penicillium hispanicum]